MTSPIRSVSIDLIEHDTEPVPVNDPRGALGGRSVNGVLRVRTDDGAEGQCIIGAFGDDGVSRVIDRIITRLGPMLLGLPSNRREWLWGRLDALTGHDLPLHPTWAWVDIALWDLAGKEVGTPIYQMLGVAQDEVSACATYPPRHTAVDGYLDEIERLVGEGFAFCKVHPGELPIELAAALPGLLRRSVGDTVGLVFDPNNGYDLDAALRVGRSLDTARFAWFEDPIPASMASALTVLTRRLTTPIGVGDEASVLLRESARLVVDHGIHLIRGSSRKLGITGLKKLCSLLEALGRRCEIGTGGNPSANAANLHVAMSSANADRYEHWLPAHGHQFAALTFITPSAQGTVRASDQPGLGVFLDEPWIGRHRTTTISIP